MPRFKYIRSDGREVGAAGPEDLAEGLISGQLTPSSWLFDERVGTWGKAGDHDVISGLLHSQQTAQPARANCPRDPSDRSTAQPRPSPLNEHVYPSGIRVFARIIDVVATPFLSLVLVVWVLSLLAASSDGSEIYWGMLGAVLMIPT